ncbi:hypothetical protein NPIL_497711 [Nephila pilipes]|uniref:Uncharacterized protein n=1 Tax=Nephila pilipes TaxID=299642 RepID=A0A8X6QFH0_NEPPI|nr:hypothetical protein NPIL_497711 [Nephila pilipes]
MDTTEQDKNEEACLIRTRLEEKLRETFTQHMEIMDGKSKIPVRRDNMAERDEMTNTAHKYLILKMELTEDLKRSNCPKQCETHKSSEEIYEDCKEFHIAQITERGTTGTKMKASEKDDFKPPTKTSKQPRKEKENFQIPITNQCLQSEKEIVNQENPKRNIEIQENKNSDNFTFLDAVKEIQDLFRAFPTLLEACKKMKSTENTVDKLNIFMQVILASFP